MRPGGYGFNVGALEADYPEFSIMGETTERRGYMAKGLGVTLRDSNLDGLAAQMDVARKRAGKGARP